MLVKLSAASPGVQGVPWWVTVGLVGLMMFTSLVLDVPTHRQPLPHTAADPLRRVG